jgi:predicted ATPase/DNA-binding winged helix-turn-helix (wHTH) protein
MYRFGDCRVDPRTRELHRGDERVHLEPQAFDLLVHLIEHRDDVVANRDLLDGVWGHRFVSEAAITTRIKEIRRAVGDDGTHQHTIRNVRGRGYRFVAELGAPEPGTNDSAMIGRQDELERIDECIGASAVVTIVGPGGVGKSTLARTVAALRAAAHRDGAHVVELAPLERDDQVLPAVARLLGVVVDPDAPHGALATIGRLDALVVLDNCEHVVDAAAQFVAEVTATPGGTLRVLATSQVRLGVSAERVVGLAPLDPQAALRLFEARARAIRSEWDTDSVGVDRVRSLLDRIDHLPLTIEMAAARLGSMTFDELEAAVASGGGWPVQLTHRTPSRRHRSLESLVEWSADLLDDGHRRVFEDCAVFAGSVSMDDAVAVLAPDAPGAAMVALGELVDRSLLAVDLGGPVARFRMLDSVKGVARRWLAASGRAGDVHHRHALAVASHVEAVDRDLRSDRERAARERLDALVPEVRQAHGWAVEHEPAIAERLAVGLHLPSYARLWSEPGTWSSTLVARAGSDRAAFPASRLLVAGAHVNAGQLDLARSILDDVLATEPETPVLGITYEILSDLCMYAGDLERCTVHADALDAIGRELGDAHMRAMAATNAALCLTFSGATDAARARLDSLARDDLSASNRAWLAYVRGESYGADGNHPAAVDAYDQAIELATGVGNPFVLSVGQSSLATEYARAGSHRTSLEVYAACLEGFRRHGNFVHAVTTLRNLAVLLASIGDDASATVIGTATSSPGLRPTYGTESEQLAQALGAIADRRGADVAAWAAEGRELDLGAAVGRARGAVADLLDAR